ncbi:MAG: adenylosuccinate synthase [Chloroflexi bacterium]|nr:adenylosuccinate synthase [Chloroflexota bacterium]
MPVTVLIGAQWGDEGKGRVADWLAADAQIMARYGGGDNAGHTITVGDEIYKMHLIPAGALREGVINILGHGMVINPQKLLEEFAMLEGRGHPITPDNMLISERAHIITPSHRAIDIAKEAARGDAKIGTTGRGIGPAYTDKVQRSGLQIYHMLDEEAFGDRVEEHIARWNEQLEKIYRSSPLDPKTVASEYTEYARKLKPFITNITLVIQTALEEGERIVCEGAQGTLLDLDLGNYPFVTSSSAGVAGALSGLGFGPQHVDRVVGATKAFSTRVGAGPMPTELHDDYGDRLRGTGENPWDEYGTTTGRARRTGWLDGVALRYAVQVNGFTELVLTKLDILSGFDELKIAVAYEISGKRTEYFPAKLEDLEAATPVYESFTGWDADIMGVTEWDALPAAARDYILKVGEIVGVTVKQATTGPARRDVINL